MTSTHPVLATLIALTVTALLAGCAGNAGDNGLPPGLPIVETVNGEAVPRVLLESLARERNLDLSIPEQRARALTELTDYILLTQAAAEAGYSKDPEFAAQVELNRLRGTANATIGKFRGSAQVDDSVLKAEYDQQIARAGRSEYDFSQLLFDSEDEALKAAGAAMSRPFNEVFDAWSGKAKQARAFQRVRLNQLPEPLGKALVGLKAGETSKIPVHTEFGWHVIHVSAVAPFVPPSFDQLKESIRQTVLGQLSEQRLAKLRSEAKVVAESPDVAAGSTDAKPVSESSN